MAILHFPEIAIFMIHWYKDFTYCCIVWDTISETQIVNLQKLQNRAARIITGASYLQRSSDVLCKLGWMT